MADLVTIEEAKKFLRVDSDDDNTTIALLISSASDAVRDVATDWDGEGDVPDRIKLAVLSRIAITYDERTSVEAGAGETVMLTPLRTLEV
jgi:Phage gp6-like head-tail connector protein